MGRTKKDDETAVLDTVVQDENKEVVSENTELNPAEQSKVEESDNTVEENKNEPKKVESKFIYTVSVAFKDRKEYGNTSYEVGSDVSDLSQERLDNLVARGIVSKNETKE